MDGFIGEMKMVEYAPFKLGDYIPKYNVTTKEGSDRYRAMADYANRMGYVIQSATVPMEVTVGDKDSSVALDVYMICEPTQPEPPSREEELRQELSQIDSRLHELDYIGIKIATGRGTREEYATEIAEMQRLADRKNEIKRELATMPTEEAL